MDDEQAQELMSEIWASGASMEGRQSDANDINICSDCLRDQVVRELYRHDCY